MHFIPAFLGISLSGIAKHIVEAPFLLLNGWLNGLYTGLVNDFEKAYVNPPVPTAGSWEDYVYGNALGLAEYLTSAIFIVMAIVIAIFNWHGGIMRRIPRMFTRVMAMVLAPTLFFWGVDQIKYYGDQASIWASQVIPAGVSHVGNVTPLLYIPTIDNPIGSIIGLALVGFFGGLLWLIVIFYQGVIIATTFLALPIFALSILSDKALKLMNWLISLFIVSAFAGRPIAVLCLQLGKAASENLPLGGTVAGNVFWVIGSLILAIGMQIILIWACLKTISFVTGNVYGRGTSRISGGNVNAKLKQSPASRATQHLASFNRTFQRRRGSLKGTAGASGFGGSARSQARSKSVSHNTRAAAVVKMAKLYPAAAAATKVKAATTTATRVQTATPTAAKAGPKPATARPPFPQHAAKKPPPPESGLPPE
jgi:hypothetical protein